MQRYLFILIAFVFSLHAQELLVIAGRDFPIRHISKKDLKALYLDKKHLIKNRPVLTLNYPPDNPLRNCFERQVLRKSRYALRRYWLQAHYNGKRPPKVIKSQKALFAYIRQVPGAIGYVRESTVLEPDFKILARITCP